MQQSNTTDVLKKNPAAILLLPIMTFLFELSDKYQMEIGYSYAFILIEANEEKHMVDNIGMEVPEMRSLVETVATMRPDDIEFEYGQGYVA